MISLLQSIVDTITSLVSFVIHTVTSLLNLIAHIPSYISFLTVSIGYLPSIVMPFAIASISLYVVFLILNRGAGK